MSSSTAKKVQVERWERQALSGYVNSQTFLTQEGVEVLSADGNASVLPYSAVKAVHFVRDLEAPHALERKSFNARPKLGGLWLRLRFRDGDLMEAMLPNDLLQLDARGFMVLPPEVKGNTQRLFVPREALREVEVLGVVGSPLRQRAPAKKRSPKDQIGLFE